MPCFVHFLHVCTLIETLIHYFGSWRPFHLILARLQMLHGVNRCVVHSECILYCLCRNVSVRSMRWLKYQFLRLGLHCRKALIASLSVVRNCINVCSEYSLRFITIEIFPTMLFYSSTEQYRHLDLFQSNTLSGRC